MTLGWPYIIHKNKNGLAPSTSSTLDILFESNDVPLFATQPSGQPWTPTRFTRSNWHPESMHCMHHQISKDFPAHYHLRPKHQRSTGFPRRGRGHCVQPSAMVYSPKSLGSAQKLEQGTRNITLKRTSLTDYANINYILIIYIILYYSNLLYYILCINIICICKYFYIYIYTCIHSYTDFPTTS